MQEANQIAAEIRESSPTQEHHLFTAGAAAPADLLSPPEQSVRLSDSDGLGQTPPPPSQVSSSGETSRPPAIKKSVKFEAEEIFPTTDRDTWHTTQYLLT
jgi:hypothetical protein